MCGGSVGLEGGIILMFSFWVLKVLICLVIIIGVWLGLMYQFSISVSGLLVSVWLLNRVVKVVLVNSDFFICFFLLCYFYFGDQLISWCSRVFIVSYSRRVSSIKINSVVKQILVCSCVLVLSMMQFSFLVELIYLLMIVLMGVIVVVMCRLEFSVGRVVIRWICCS